MIGWRAQRNTAGLAAWRAKLQGDVAQRIATRSARRQQARAREEAAVDTGALHVSISVLTPTESDYAENLSNARSLRPAAPFFPEPARPARDSASVVVGAEYGQYVNDGTIHVAARPFWHVARLETEAALAEDAEHEWRT